MKSIFYFLFFFYTCTVAAGNKDTLVRKHFGINLNPAFFIDYPGTSISPGLALSLFYKQKAIFIQGGILGGYTSPVFEGINYYIGSGYDFFKGKKKSELTICVKGMYSYLKKYDVTHKQFSILPGISYSYKINRFIIGIQTFAWWTSISYKRPVLADPNAKYFMYPYDVKLIYGSSGKYNYTGLLSTQALVLRLAYVLKSN